LETCLKSVWNSQEIAEVFFEFEMNHAHVPITFVSHDEQETPVPATDQNFFVLSSAEFIRKLPSSGRKTPAANSNYKYKHEVESPQSLRMTTLPFAVSLVVPIRILRKLESKFATVC